MNAAAGEIATDERLDALAGDPYDRARADLLYAREQLHALDPEATLDRRPDLGATFPAS